MHSDALDFVKYVRSAQPEFFKGNRVLEIGSLVQNGSVRNLFNTKLYTGVDTVAGKGVDVVGNGHEHKKEKLYDVVISTETLQYDRFWQSTLRQMMINVRLGGLFLVTCASGNRIPDQFSDTEFYRNISLRTFSQLIDPAYFATYFLTEARDGRDLYFYGVKSKKTVIT